MNNITTESAVEAQCVGKHGFVSRTLAMKVAKKGARAKDKPMAAYVCPHCRMWRVGQSALKRTQAGVGKGIKVLEKQS